MPEAITNLDEITAVAQLIDCGTVTAREYLSRDGHRFVGYRATPDSNGFLAWERRGDFLHGFTDKTVRRFASEEDARAWVLARLNAANDPEAVMGKRAVA
jgi:hypothetical protein